MLSEHLSALTDHNPRHCVVCTPDEASSAAGGPGGDRSAAPPPSPTLRRRAEGLSHGPTERPVEGQGSAGQGEAGGHHHECVSGAAGGAAC